ncbi:protein phosphatase 2C domain-containing protein [Streptomyces sp. GC420]|uniref:protein phosphatase 2C domain-containing protein n=1 Tax=Streptomyces sp. GC420 TaxID=2697568 RepID=UPI0014152CA6|nr:protein phosphatase 2C domain-containing protein [Streptomyces sp. GC420]NBM18603.1 hypothetical protein [Streptomyces sp. GC420]
MRIELATEPGSPGRPNEDYAAAVLPASGQGGALVLLDGVTPPAGDFGCAHDVPWFTARLGGALAELSGSRRDLTLAEILSASIRRTAAAHGRGCDLSHARTPQATVVLARWDEERVEHLVLSDSALLIEGRDGSVTPVLDDRIERLPREVLSSLAATDALRNAEGGFFTAAADPAVAEHALTGSLPRSRVRALLALSDGASRWVQLFRQGDWSDCLAVVRKDGARGLVDRVRSLERDRPEGGAVRRWKRHDDAAVVFAEL